MRFKTFIDESTMWLPLPGIGMHPRDIRDVHKKEINIDEEDIHEFAGQVYSSCSRWLNEMKGKVYWRGFYVDQEENGNKPLIIEPYTDREPKDTNYSVHTFVDNYLNKRFGWMPRSQGVFCSPKAAEASFYGQTFGVFPIGEYRYVWAKNSFDMTRDVNTTVFDWLKAASARKMRKKDLDITEVNDDDINSRKLKAVLDKFEYTDKNGYSNIRNEMMIDCKSYILIPLEMTNELYKVWGYKK